MTSRTGPQKILVTGADGLLGGLVFRNLDSRPDLYAPYAMVRMPRFPWTFWKKRPFPFPPGFRPVTVDQPARPLNLYAASKVLGEALAHVYAHTHGLSCLCLRIGWVTSDNRPPDASARCRWCSHDDLVQLVERCLAAPEALRFDIFFGLSANDCNFADIGHAREVLGFAPRDKAPRTGLFS